MREQFMKLTAVNTEYNFSKILRPSLNYGHETTGWFFKPFGNTKVVIPFYFRELL